MISGKINSGDGHTLCDQVSRSLFASQQGGVLLGPLTCVRLCRQTGPSFARQPNQDPEVAVKEWKVKTGFDYEVRGAITTMRLDTLVDHDVQVLKIDVEGERDVPARKVEVCRPMRRPTRPPMRWPRHAPQHAPRPTHAGFETPILQGGEALFKKYNVWFILAECNKDIIKEEGQKDFIK